MNSMELKHTDETLDTMMAEYAKNLTSTELFDFLLSSTTYVKTGDTHGWKRKFETPEPVPKPKRLKQSPNKAIYEPLPNCRKCNSDQVIDDVAEGQIVCVACGLIQQVGVFTGDPAHCSWDMLYNRPRVCIHHYSRVVYFLTVVRLLQGESSPQITDDTLSLMRAEIGGRPVTVEVVNAMLRKLKLADRYRKHRWSLVKMFGGDCPYYWDGRLVLELAKQFRTAEYAWLHFKETLTPNRTFFFSYRFLLYQFLHERGLEAPRSLLLKGEKQLQAHINSYFDMCTLTPYNPYLNT